MNHPVKYDPEIMVRCACGHEGYIPFPPGRDPDYAERDPDPFPVFWESTRTCKGCGVIVSHRELYGNYLRILIASGGKIGAGKPQVPKGDLFKKGE